MLLLEVISGDAPPTLPVAAGEEQGLYQLRQHCASIGLFWGAVGILNLSLPFMVFGPQGSGYLSQSGAR